MTEVSPWVLGLVGGALLLILLALVSVRLLAARERRAGSAYLRALEALALGDRAAALARFREAVEEDTDNVSAYLLMGRLLRVRGDYDRALRVHRELRVRPLDGDTRRRVDREILHDLVAAGRWQEAKDAAGTLRAGGDDDPELLRQVGLIEENLRNWEAALETFEELERRRKSPSTRRIALYRAFVARDYQQRGKIKEARKYYESALKEEPSLPGALLYLGDLQRADGKLSDAIRTWKRLISMNPNTASLVFERLERATFELDPARVTELAADYERILADHPEDVSTMRALARLHRRRGDLQEALRILAEATDQQPGHPDLAMERIEVMIDAGRRDEARDAFQTMVRREKDGATEIFTCKECGYRSKEYAWRCPSCSRWETFTA
jgi:lipopolysaccharide biosynthesis regulator YciM